MYRRKYPDLPFWRFELAHVAGQVYRVTARYATEDRFSVAGTYINALFDECRLIAAFPAASQTVQ